MTPSESGNPRNSRPAPIQLNTRFIRPFFFRRRSVLKAQELLDGGRFAGFLSPWTPAGHPGLYVDELLDHVAAHLFGTVAGPGRCGYLRLDHKPANRAFRDLSVDLRGKRVPVTLDWTAGVEVFLSPQGVGVLSVAFVVEPQGPGTAEAVDFNYLIARAHATQPVRFRVSHRSDDKTKWDSLGDEQRTGIPAPPALDAPLEDRLGNAGGEFTMDELTATLLAPLGDLELRRVQRGFSLYTVALFGDETDLDEDVSRRAIGPFLSALAQVEEPTHAGGLETSMNVPNLILNRRHWAATGQLACAHVVADQPIPKDAKGRGYNAERVQRVRDKYFIPWLVALLERLSLQRTLDDACEIVGRTETSGPREAAREFSVLKSGLLDLSVGGNFTQVSSRHAVHTFFELCREGFDIVDLWTEVRHSIFDIDTRYADEERVRLAAVQAELAERQTAMSRDIKESLSTSVRLQEAVHIIEIFLVTVYSAEFMKTLLETSQSWFAADEHALHRFHLASPFLVAGAALTGFILTLRFVRRGRRKH